jgi:hypothetical protein
MSMDYGDWSYFQRLIEQNDDALESEIGLSQANLAQVARNLREVAVALDATIQALHQAGVVDANAIFARVKETMSNPAAQPVQCIQCGKQVPRNAATSTPLGMVCTGCAGGAP